MHSGLCQEAAKNAACGRAAKIKITLNPKTNRVQRHTGAGGGGRTRTVSLPPDFESGTSANSITPAHNAVYYTVMLQENQALLNNL